MAAFGIRRMAGFRTPLGWGDGHRAVVKGGGAGEANP
jgi:hypothetical protein